MMSTEDDLMISKYRKGTIWDRIEHSKQGTPGSKSTGGRAAKQGSRISLSLRKSLRKIREYMAESRPPILQLAYL